MVLRKFCASLLAMVFALQAMAQQDATMKGTVLITNYTNQPSVIYPFTRDKPRWIAVRNSTFELAYDALNAYPTLGFGLHFDQG